MAEPFNPHVKNVATERNLYVVPSETAKKSGVDPNFIETGYSRMVDSELLNHFHQLINTKSNKHFDQTIKIRASQFIIFQYFRTRSALNQFKNDLDGILQDFCNQATVIRYGEKKRYLAPIASLNEHNITLMISDMLFDRDRTFPMVQSLCSRQWRLWENRTERSLLTSDAPVVLDPLKRRLSDTAFLSDATRIYLPITPRYVVEISEQPCPGSSRDVLQKQVLPRSRLGSLNKLQIVQSDRLVISDQDNFTQAEECCRLDPTIRRPGTLKIGCDLPKRTFPSEMVAKAVEKETLREREMVRDEEGS